MIKNILTALLHLSLAAPLAAFELQGFDAGRVRSYQLEVPEPPRAAPVAYASYQVNGAEVIVPHIDCGTELLAALRPGDDQKAFAARLRQAFGSAAGAKPVPLTPKSKAELELASRNPGAAIVSLNQFLPPGAAALFNRGANFGGPNCFNAAFTAAGMMQPNKLRHVGNHEADQLLSMYFKKAAASDPRPGDVMVLNDGDHAVFYLGGGLIFHKKSFLKQHVYRVVPLERAYEPEPYEWKPGPFDGGSPFNSSEPIRKRDTWRPTGAQPAFGQATAEEQAKVDLILFIGGHIEKQAPNWAFAREMGYFTERLLEDLISDWSALARSANPVLKAYYHRLESYRDQANQSIETELLSSPHAQSNADSILRGAWLPRNDYSRDLTVRLLGIYGRDASAAGKALDAIGKDFDGQPLKHIKSASRAAFQDIDRAGGAAVAYTDKHARRLAAMAGAGLTQVNMVDGGINGQDQYYFFGVPEKVRRVTPAGTGLMRHWTSDIQVDGVPVVDLIVKSGLLKAGPRPYIIPESHRADFYQDLHGVFFTTPDFPPGQLWMGLTKETDYVDFVVDPGMGALYLAPGNYLFPCPTKIAGWIADAYRKWKATGVMQSGMQQMFAQIDRDGGLHEPIDIPVTVVRYQKGGKTVVLRPDLLNKPY